MKRTLCGLVALLVSTLCFAQAQGDITWKPVYNGLRANYVQSPGAMRDFDGSVYVVGHAGYCCYAPPYGYELPFILRYASQGATENFPAMDPAPDTHELGFVSLVAYGDGWLMAGVRTTWFSYQDGNGQNRVRTWFAYYADLMEKPLFVLWDAVGPWDEACSGRNTCEGPGPMMPALFWMNGELWLSQGDNMGILQGSSGIVFYTVVLDVLRTSVTVTKQFVSGWPFINGRQIFPPVTDIAVADDGTLRALVSERYIDEVHTPYWDQTQPCWFYYCNEIFEWVSYTGGQSWEKGERSWVDARGRIIWDAGYIRDPLGHVEINNTGLVSNVLTFGDYSPTSGGWSIHWWLPSPPSRPRAPRKHLEAAP
jgi:hypothetical protein